MLPLTLYQILQDKEEDEEEEEEKRSKAKLDKLTWK